MGYSPWSEKELLTNFHFHRPQDWIASGQITTREGVQPHPSADNWIKALLFKALPSRARPNFIHCQFFPSRHLQKPLRLRYQRSGRRIKKHSLIVAKTKTTLQTVNQDEKAECYVSDEGQDKTPEKQLNEVEIGKLSENEFRIVTVKMIQDLGKRTKAKIEKM